MRLGLGLRAKAKLLAGALVLVCVVATSDDARAGDEGYAVIAYAIVTGGGLTTAAGSQISVLEGEYDPSWGYTSLAFAGANAVTSGVLLIVAGVMAATDDDEGATIFATWGGIQMSIAIAGLVSGATVVANQPPAPPGEKMEAAPAGATLTFAF